MSIGTSCYDFWISCILVITEKMKNRIWKNESSDKLILCRIIKVEKLVISSNTEYFGVLNYGYVNNTIYDHTTKGNIFDWFIGLLLEQNNVLFIIF